MTATSETLHLGMSGQLREYTNAFASILYDTHLLGDYTTTRIEPLLDLNSIIDDMIFILSAQDGFFKRHFRGWGIEMR